MKNRTVITVVISTAFAWSAVSKSIVAEQSGTTGTENVAILVSQLNSESKTAQVDAAAQLSNLGPFAGPAVAALSEHIQSNDVALAYECLVALGNIGPLAGDSVPAVESMASGKGPLQATAINALRKIGRASPPAINRLKSLAADVNDEVAVASIRCLNTFGSDAVDDQMATRTTKALTSKHRSVRNAAVAALGEMGQIAVSALKKTLGNDDETVYLGACHSIAAIGSDAAELTPQLLKLLNSNSEQVVRVAALALGSVASQPGKSLPGLEKLLSSPAPAIRADVVTAIGGFGTDASKSITPLAALLRDDNSSFVRVAAADSLGRIGFGSTDAATALARAIEGNNGPVTIHAANALSQLGPVAVAPLTTLLDNEDYAHLAAGVLAEMGSDAKPAVEGLTRLLENEDRQLRREAFIALASMGEDAKAAVPTLRDILTSATTESTRAGAAYVLGKIGEEGCVEDLKKIMAGEEDPNSKLKLAAAWSLINLRAEDDAIAVAALPVFINALDSEEPIARREAISAIATLGARKESTMAKLVQLAGSDDDVSVRAEALHSLAVMEATGSDVLATSIAALESEAPNVRNAATFLLGSLGTAAKASASRLRQSARSGPEFDRMVAAWALVRVENSAEHMKLSLPLMQQALNLPNPEAQLEAIRTIELIGVSNPEIKAALTSAAEGDHDEVSEAARKALKALH